MFMHTKSTRMSVGKTATLFGFLWLILTLSVTARAQFTPAPGRGVNHNTDCPPNQDGTKVEPSDARDKDVNGDSRKDYFLGEWKFVDGSKDLIVRRWCINQTASTGRDAHFNDFLSFEVITSLNGVETNDPTKKIDPTVPV